MPSAYKRFTIVLHSVKDADLLEALQNAAGDNGASELVRQALRQYLGGPSLQDVLDAIAKIKVVAAPTVTEVVFDPEAEAALDALGGL